MGPNTKILTKRDIALIRTPFDSSRKNKQFIIKKSQNRMKNDRVMPINVQAQKWYLAYFGPSVGYFGHIF